MRLRAGGQQSGSEAGAYLRLIDFVYHSTKVDEKARMRLGVIHDLECLEAGPPNHDDDKVDSDQ